MCEPLKRLRTEAAALGPDRAIAPIWHWPWGFATKRRRAKVFLLFNVKVCIGQGAPLLRLDSCLSSVCARSRQMTSIPAEFYALTSALSFALHNTFTKKPPLIMGGVLLIALWK